MNLDLRHLLAIARRWWWILLLAPLVAGASARYSISQQQPLYAATATLKMNSPQNPGGSDYLAIEGAKSQAETYRQLIETRPVMESVIAQLGLPYGSDELQNKVSTQTVAGTVLVKVRVSDPDPQAAATIANVVADTFQRYTVDEAAKQRGPARQALDDQIATTASQIEALNAQIAELEARPDAADPEVQTQVGGLRDARTQQQAQLNSLVVSANEMDVTAAASQTQVSVSEHAVAPSSPFAPQTALYTMLAVIAGLVTACAVVVLLEYLDNTVKADADFPALAGAPLLAAIGTGPTPKDGVGQLFILDQPTSFVAEAVRLLRTNIEFAATTKEITTLTVTSAGPAEGKSTLTANLAVAMAQGGFSVVVVDADLRRPSQHKIFNIRNERGLTTLLTHPDQDWRWAAVNASIPQLRIIPSGPIPPNPADLLGLERFKRLMGMLSQDVDVVLVDSPPVLAVSDSSIIAPQTDGVVFVCQADRTRIGAVQQALQQLRQGNVRIIGVVLNRQRGHASNRYYYGDYYAPVEQEDRKISARFKRPIPAAEEQHG